MITVLATPDKIHTSGHANTAPRGSDIICSAVSALTKTDFKKAADAFLKENPRFMGQGMKVVSTGKPDGADLFGQDTTERKAFRKSRLSI